MLALDMLRSFLNQFECVVCKTRDIDENIELLKEAISELEALQTKIKELEELKKQKLCDGCKQ